MKKPTILRTLIFVLAMLFNFASYSQNLIAYNSKFTKNFNENIFLKTNDQIGIPIDLRTNTDNNANKLAAPPVNPAIKYAQAPYLGTVSICPNDGKQLPKLFLCGINETRKIETGITDAQSIIWEKFNPGGSCLNVSNTNCANETAAASCWTEVGNTPDYVASTAGQFRVKIVDNTGTPYTFYFNVYQNTLDPGAIAKNDIIKYGTSCTINGKITVNGFGSGYEYGLTTTSSPPSSWQSSNVFNVTAAGSYNVFIRLAGVAGSCDFKIPNIVINSTNFSVSTQINSPKCGGEFDALGSIRVVASDVNLQYVYKLTGPTNITIPATTVPNYTFSGLTPGTYTLETSIVGTACMKDTKNNIIIVAPPKLLNNNSTVTRSLSACSLGEITGAASGGKTPYRYSISIDGGAFTPVANVDNKITVAKSGNYIVRLEDGNGCTADKAITIGAVDKPIYNVTKEDGNCTGKLGSITINVTAPNGYTDIKYSINNGTSFVTTNVFPNLSQGIYYVVVQYKKSGVSGSGGAYCQDPAIMTNVGAATPLSASAGIAALSGCGIAPNELQGLARIVNPQGGIPFAGPFPYKYSFKDGIWQDSNEAYINPGGPYTFKIKDAAGCVFDMPGITLDQKPAPPSIKVLDPVFNCDGSATSTVEVNGGVPDTKYSYKYYIDGFLNNNTPPNVFPNVGGGKHTITVEYTVLNVSTYSNLLIENFGSGGTTTTPGIAGTYCFNDQREFAPYTCSLNGTPTRSVEDNQYSVTNFFWRDDDPNANNTGAWFHFKDHTTAGNATPDPLGRYLLINIGKAAGDYGVLYSKDIVDVIPNQPVMIDLYVANLLRRSRTGAAPIVIFELVDPSGNVVASDNTGKIAEDAYDVNRNKWIQKSISLNPGNNTKLTFKIRSGSTDYGGNDLVMDDIWVRQIPKACGTVRDEDITIDSSKAFSAEITKVVDVKCFGDKNGELTITARNFDPKKGFQYSIDGATWVTVVPVPAASTGSVTIDKLLSKNYQIRVRYENIATSCTWPLSQDINTPEVLKVSAKVSKPATCKIGATITAEATDGTPDYKYELRAANGTTVVRAFQTSGEFLDIPVGNYKVIAKDANKCETNVLASVNVVAAVRPTADFEPVSKCFDKNTGTDITVKVTGGVGPYSYTVTYNGGTPSLPSPTFDGPNFTYKAANEGTYKFKVKDSFDCDTDEITITIKAQLLTSTTVTTGLDCDPAPNNRAIISGSIQGGTAPYTVSIISGATTGTLVQPVANGTSFTYSIVTSGYYKFQIKDANNCITTSEATIDPLDAITLRSNNVNPKCNGGSTGSVELLPSGGSGGFTYSRDNIMYNGISIIKGLSAGNYTFYVKDSNKCTKSINVTLTDPPAVVASASIPTNTTCSATTLITTSGVGGVGGFTYSFNGSTTFNGVNTLLVTNKTTVQTITYSVKDANDCIDTKTIDIPAYNPPVGVNISTPIAITCEVGKTTTSVTVTPKVGGIAPFTYLITAGAGTGTTNSTGIFSGLVAGSYTFQITDANGCKDSGSITIDAAATIAVSGKKTDVKCVGLTNGTATFTVTGASSAGNFTYTLTPASGTVTQLNDEVTVTGLGAGTYKLQVRDKTTKCLSNEASVTINPATAISITAATGSNVNCGNSVSNIVVSVTGGVPNYKYAYVLRGAGIPAASAFSTTNTTINTGATQSNLFWDVYVMDQNDCTAGPFNLDITRETSPTVKSPAPATFCFKAPSTTAINLSTFFNLGTGTHTYTVNGLSVSNPTNYNITSSGTYTIVAKDANGCTATATYVVNPELTILATRVKDLTCTNNAEISFTANGGSNIYSKYEVQFNAAGPWTTVTSPFSTANAGDYQFRVTDNANCQALSNKITVTAKTTPSFLHNEKQPTCIGVGNGVINITDPTGLAPFSYSIKKGSVTVSTTASTANLNAGVYDVLLTDAKGCTASAQITLNDPIALNARVNMTPLACNSDNTTKQATITVTLPTGGTGTGYEYSFNGGAFSATATYSTSIAGTVTVEMRDSNHCTQSLTSQTFAALNGPKITGFTASLITCKPGEDKSNVDITVSNGVGALSYTIVSGPTNNATGATDGKFTGLADGVYVFKVTDANGCSDTDSYTVKPKVSITASLLSQVNVACNGGSTGSAKITVSAYTGTYTATLTAGTGTVTKTGSTVDITNLAQGLYTLRVTDDLTACFKDVNFTITELSPVTLTLTSNKNANCGQSLSKVIVTAGGGKLPYSYAFRSTTGNPAAGDYVLNANTADLDPAITTWYAWVKDANGCEKSLLITIAKDPDAVVNLPAQQCFAAPFTITLSGTGKAPLEFTVNGSTLPGTTYNVTASGTYKLGVKDANGCTNFKDYVVDKQIFASAIPGKDLTCSVPTAAEITVNITNGTAPYSYQIYNGSLAVGAPVTGIATTSFTETFTSPGNYSFEVTDSKGCPVKTNALPVTATGTIVANPVTTLANCHGNSDGTVTFTGSGGKAPYKYSLDGSTLDFSNVFGGLAVGPHSYIVEDARGCRDVGTITIGQPNKIDPSFTVNDIKCYGDIPGSIEITGINDGVGPFIFTLFDDKTNTAIHTSTPTSSRTYVFPNNLVFGDYHVLIVDSKGCEAKSGKLRISTHPYLKFAPPVISGTCKAGATVNLFLDTTLPSAPNYKYSIYGDASTVSAATPATTYQFTGLKFGQTYFFQVEDSNGCFSIVEVPIAPLSLIQFTSIVSTDVSCNVTPSVANGSIKFTVSNYDPSVDNLRVEVLDQLTNLRLSPRVFRDYVVTSTTSITDTFINLPTGSYTLQALELDGTECSNATTFEIGKPLQPVAVSVISQTNDNCNADARVVVKATGGTKPYEYTFVADGALEPTGGYSSANPLIINFESGTDWDIWVKDKNGCTSKVDVSIGKDLPPVAVAGPAVPCFTGAIFTVDLSQYFTITVGAPIYTLDGVDLPSSIATITAAKTYTIGVRDGNGCTATASYVVRDILTLSPTLTKELDCNPPAPNATVTVEAQGGDNTNYTYTITAGTTINITGATTGIFTGLDAGNYTFEVNDGACTATATIKIDALVKIVPAKLEINPLCIGANGSVEISATGGTGIYTYQKGAAPTLPTETSNKFVQTAAEGTVTYYIKDSKGCIETINATVTDPTPVSFVSVVVDQMLCGLGNTPNEAKITVTASGGAGGYEYSFDNGANYSVSSVFTTKISGTYNIIVKDANGCISVMRPEIIDALDPPVIRGFNKTQMTCPALESDVTINHSNGIGTVTYTMVSGTTMNTTGDTSGTYTGLKAGDYVFRITDSNNCTDEELVTILALPTLQMQEQVVANVGCITEKTGSATFTASDFFASGAFTYSVVTTPTGLTFTDTKVGDVLTLSDLGKGHYEVTFRDNTTHCSVTKSVDITEPALALSLTAVASNVHCNQPVSQLTMTAVGGTPNYTYSIVQSGAGAGTYSTATSIDTTTLTNGVVVGLGMTWLVDVHIKDANNCTAMTTITITKDDTPTVTTPTLASNQCIANENYTFTATGTGVAPLSFSIDGINYFESSGTTYTFTVPAPTTASQSYTVYVKDVNGCIATSTTSTIVYKPLTFKVVQDKEITCVPMPATTAAQFTLTAADGNPAYTYEVNINNAGFNSITSPYTTSVIGRYVFRVTDSNSCSVTSDVIIVDGPVDPAFTITKVDVKCNGDNTGTITVAPSGGVRPYTFALSGANANNSGDATGLYTGLRAGTYNVVVTDSYGCTSGVTPAIVITEPGILTADANLSVNNTCSNTTVITVVGDGGTRIATSTLGYLYSFDRGVTFDTSDKITIDINNGTVQTIWYSVKDANGCTTAPKSITVNPLNKPSKLDFNATLVTCKAGEDVSTVQVKATNGVGALEFRIVATNTATSPTLFGPITTTGSAVAASFPGLLPGDYTFEVKDSNGCTFQDLYTVKEKVNIAVDGQLDNGVVCKGEENGKVTFKVSNFNTGFAHTIIGVNAPGIITPVGTDTFVLTNLAVGSYTINVTDNVTNCVASFTVDVPEPDALELGYITLKNANCTDLAKIKATASKGTAGYTYAFVKAGDPVVYGTEDTAELDKAFTWRVWAKDSHGCETFKDINILVDASPVIVSAIPNHCPSTTGTYDITVTANGFNANLEYSLDGNSWGRNKVLVVKSSGAHIVYVRDENKCTANQTVTILEPLRLEYDIIETPICEGNQGEVTLRAYGGTVAPSYEYSKDGINFDPNPIFNGLVPGNYTFTVRDTGTGCTKEVEVKFEIPNKSIIFSLEPTNVICNGESNGTVTVNMATPSTTVNNNPVYTYKINPSPVGMVLVGNVFTNLPADTYTVTVTSGKGCEVPMTVIVGQPALIIVDTPIVSNYGCATDNKTIYATITVDKTKITGGSKNYTRFQFVKTSNANEIVYDGTSNIYTESDFLGGKYVVNVFDNKGCMGASTEVEILPFTSMDKIDVVITPITCATNEAIAVKVKDFNGVTFTIPLEYKLDGVGRTVFSETNTNGVFTNLPIGHYLISVKNTATGCVIKKDHFVNDPNTFRLTAENVTNIKCYGVLEGSVDLILTDNLLVPTNDAGEFKYEIKDVAGTLVKDGTSDATGKATINGLKAGLYNVKAVLSKTPFCEVVTSFSIQQPITELKISEIHAPISCIPGNDGKIVISADGGWPGGYQYELVGVSTGYSDQSEFSNLSAGTYILNVKDSKGCVATTTVTLNNPTPIAATATATTSTLLCYGDKTGVITVSAPTGGQGSNYAYILNLLSVNPVISTASQDSPIFTGLGAGKYSVTIVDQLNCNGTTAEVIIGEPLEIIPTLELATGITCKTAATLKLSAIGGSGPYEYSSDKNFTTVLGSLPAIFAVGVGDHQYFVRDSKGCVSSISNNVTIDALTPLTLKLDLTNAVVYCKGSATAAIDAEAIGGLTNYVYTLFDGNGVVVRPAQPTGYFDLLPKGVYVVRVDSGDCQYDSASININEPAQPLSVIPTVIDATCFASNDGKISIAATGGTGVIKYAISPNLGMFDDKFEFDRLTPGVYQVLVQDENSCFQLLNLEIKEPPLLGAKVVGPILQEICDGDIDGAFSIEIFGGKPPYSVSLDNENGTYIPVVGTQHDFVALKGGRHTVYIKDATCISTLEVIMDKAVILDPIAETNYDCVNNAQTNMVTVTVDASNTDLTQVDYSLDSDVGPWQAANIFTNIAPGKHYIVARHTNGCKVPTTSFEIRAYDKLTLGESEGKPEMNIISVTAAGGAPAYEYSFNGEPFTSSNKYKIYKTGDYEVIVRDQNGCTATTTVHAIYVDVCLDNYFTPNGDGVYDTWGPGCTNIYNNLVFSIFDRYGRVIAKYHYGQKWDGRYNGAELPSGDYWYVLKLNDEKDAREFVGHFTLYR
ncbi:T9SS type B sorting domain-containing protein [Flavobacterium collinsii]|uniref:Adhesin containing a type B C-terminal secretion signal SprB n=1 Tax=Flavobacterium collinsii TaxID=1114861 RepID=A0A9W4TEX1_9FLAO|nr:T9SS type B sorting domain-containing protein [Flavobacterium collinsii]CAI2765993.1 adhesin precursor containing a type B C-terminal secretion signal SprB [Flavobacterium collinsii]